MVSKLDLLLREIKNDKDISPHITCWKSVPAREPVWADFPQGLSEALVAALKQRGIERLYSHQRESFEAAEAGRDCVVVTPTASGKTLCYNLPVINAMLRRKDCRALYLFPTKALAQDQQAELNQLLDAARVDLSVVTYDGDTPRAIRAKARDSGRLIVSNPDMLHKGILPNHTRWINLFKGLRYIIIDEIHYYRGILGSHMANVLRRLLRITAFYQAKPQFICCSATIGNPAQLAEAILGRPVSLIERNGAPCGPKEYILYNPPLVDATQGIRRGVVNESSRLATKILQNRIKTIVFTRSRVNCELIASYINRNVANFYNNNNRIRVESYRGGYLPAERRAIEKGMRDGSINGIIATNALELGIDVGSLDAAVLAGLPASIASIRQQSGRAGRRGRRSAALLVASASAIDQFLVNNHDYFFAKSPEHAYINADNGYILLGHLKCALFELPFADNEKFGEQSAAELLPLLEEDGIARRVGDSWYYSEQGYPAEQISLRSASTENVVVINQTDGKHQVVGEMDLPSAKMLLFDQAVYLHRGEQFQVRKLDVEQLNCYIESSNLNYYTDSIDKTDIKLLAEDSNEVKRQCRLTVGDMLVRTQVTGYKKITFFNHQNVGYGDVDLPEEQMHTRGLLLNFIAGEAASVIYEQYSEQEKIIIINSLATVLRNLLPIFLYCEKYDLGVLPLVNDPYCLSPAIYFYDRYPGGSGLAEALADRFQTVLVAAYQAVMQCGCASGCPSCVGPYQGEETGYAGIFNVNQKKISGEFLRRWLSNDKKDRMEDANNENRK